MKWIAVAFVAIGILALAGISAIASPKPVQDPGTVVITMTEMRFSPNRIDARVGQPITLVIDNRGSVRHDLAFPAGTMPNLQGIETLTMPGETTRLTLTFDHAGVFPFICTIPNHAASGMTGAVFVNL